MKISIFAFSRQGCGTALNAASFFEQDDVSIYTVERLLQDGFGLIPKPSNAFFEALFQKSDVLLFVGSCGIAVRKIAPYVRSKKTDPAVIVTDELARFTISLLSGHIGGANELAKKLSSYLGSIPVITTATDINNRFSADAWAAVQGYFICNMTAAKEVSAAILERDVPIAGDVPLKDVKLPSGLFAGDKGPVGIYLGYKTVEPFDSTMRIVPKMIHLGIGCRKGIAKEAVDEAVDLVLKENKIDIHSIAGVFSIDLKAEEQGLIDYCLEKGVPFRCFSADELNAVEGDFTPSAFVRSVTGADNVCERAALIEADQLIIKKTAHNGVTVAAAVKYPEVSFE